MSDWWLNNPEDLQVKSKVDIIDPTVNDDSLKGYRVNSKWVNTDNNKAFICVDNTDGAAVWDGIDNNSGGGPTADHGTLTGLTDDDHTQYALLDGRSGGSDYIGGIDAGDDLTLESTSHATKGDILFGNVKVDTLGNLLMGNTLPALADGPFHVHSGTAGAVTANTDADEGVFESAGDGGISILTPDANNSQIYFGSASSEASAILRWSYDADLFTLGSVKSGAAVRFISSISLEVMRLDSNQDVLIGLTSSNTGKVHIDQASTTGAKPVLTLDQGDVSEEFIRLIGTSTTDATQSLVDAVDLTTPGTLTGWFKVYVQDDQATNPITDGVYYVPFYTAPTA